MKKKVLSLLLVGTMLVGMLAGCGDNKDNVSNNDEKQNTSEQEGGEQEGGEQELTTVKILANYLAGVVSGPDWQWDSSVVGQALKKDLEEIGIRLEVELVDAEQISNIVSTRMASGIDLPDLVSYCWQADANNTIKKWADSGLVYELTTLLEQYDEDGSIMKFYTETAPGAMGLNAFDDGSLYWFSYLWSSEARKYVDKETGTPYTNADGTRNISIRKDWVEAVGETIKESYTLDELRTLLIKFREEDANGNGLQDEIVAYNIGDFANTIATAFGLTRQTLAGYFEGEYEVFSNFYHENFPAYIEYMKSLYDAGVYDTVAISTPNDQLIAEDRVALADGYSKWDFESYLPTAEPGKLYYMPVYIDDDGNLDNGFYQYADSTGTASYCNYFIPTVSKNVEAVIRLMDYVYSEDYYKLCQLGVEGYGYDVDENGNYVVRPNPDALDDMKNLQWITIAPYILPQVYAVQTVNERVYGTEKEEAKGLHNYKFSTEYYETVMDANMMEFSNQSLAMPTPEEQSFIDEKTSVLHSYANELLTDLIMGRKSLDDMPQYLNEMEELGLKEYVDIIQARLDRYLAY